MELNQRGALITGAASGLGAACAKLFVEKGAKVTLLDLNEEAGNALAAELGDAAQFVKVDVTDSEQVANAMNAHVDFAGGLHVVVQCAGVATPSTVVNREGAARPLERFAKVIEINLIGTINVVRLATEKMVQNEGGADGEKGVFIHTASVAAFDGQIGQTAYSASKGGVAAMTLPLARELARQGIRVVTVAPGIFNTPMMAGLPEKAQASLAQQVPFPSRLGNPEEYASLVQHIINNVMINGEVIRLDGALRMGAR